MADTFRVGEWFVEPQLNTISAKGKSVRLEPKVMQVLLCLASHPEEVVSKERLIQSVWEDTFVGDDVLTRSISELRRAFGDDAKESRFIQTIPKSGYRLIAAVTLDSSENKSISQEIDECKALPAIKPHSGLLNARVIAACFMVLAIAAVSLYVWKIRKAAASGKSNTTKSIAVLPFKSVGPEVGDEYLGLEIADTLITRLSSTKQLVVRPLGAVRKYGDKNQDPIAAGRELSVELVLDGSTQRESDRVRVTVRLFKVADGSALWADRYDEKFSDIFAVQDRVTEKVARSLSLSLTDAERKLLTKRYTDNTEAYRLYLLGRYFENKGTEEGNRKGIEYFNLALTRDPNYALAYAGLADSYNGLGGSGYLLPKEGSLKAKEAALKALEIDGSLAEVHASLAEFKFWAEYDWVGAEAEWNLAHELDPNIPPVCAHLLLFMGRHDESIASLKQTLRFNPTDIDANMMLGMAFYFARRYDQAVEQCRNTLGMDPSQPGLHLVLGLAYEQKGMYEEAIAEIQKYRTVGGDNELQRPWAVGSLGEIYAVLGQRDRANGIIEELKQQSPQRYADPYLIAVIYTGLGERDQAFKHLEQGYQDRSFFMTYLKVDPRLDSLRSDPRYTDLLRRMGLG